ncbi:MAG: dihydrofolate reductase [Alphaproteobacteria bacterium]|nr:dihydrofolate reductase [Alphaproteobacteria bacterium]
MKYEFNGKKFNYPEIIMIVAATEDGLIGKGDGMPWKSSFDFKWFKSHTSGFPTIFGRKTAAGMPGFPLQNRPCAILSNTIEESYQLSAGGASSVHKELTDAIAHYGNFDKVFIAGGKSIYEFALQEQKPFGTELSGIDMAIRQPLVDTVIRTVFPDGHVTGDVYFKELESILTEQFSIEREHLYRLFDKTYQLIDDKCPKREYPVCQKCTADCPFTLPEEFADDIHSLKKTDTPFPWIRFETWRRKAK